MSKVVAVDLSKPLAS